MNFPIQSEEPGVPSPAGNAATEAVMCRLVMEREVEAEVIDAQFSKMDGCMRLAWLMGALLLLVAMVLRWLWT